MNSLLPVTEYVPQRNLQSFQQCAQTAQGDALIAVHQTVQRGRRQSGILCKISKGLLALALLQKGAELFVEIGWWQLRHRHKLRKFLLRMRNIWLGVIQGMEYATRTMNPSCKSALNRW